MVEAIQETQLESSGKTAVTLSSCARGDITGLEEILDGVVYDTEHKACLISIPKVACTILKATVVMNSPLRQPYKASGLTIHRFVASMRSREQLDRLFQAPDVFRWAVLRDPYRRLLSAYLNKIVGGARGAAAKPLKLKTIRGAQLLQGKPFDPEQGISFEEFIRYLGSIEDSAMNIHWMPQSRFIGDDLSRFAHVGRLENLKVTLDLLYDRFGYQPELDPLPHLGGAKQHSTKYSEATNIPEPWRQPARVLRKSKVGVPPFTQFYPPELRKIVQQRYADDLALYEAVAISDQVRNGFSNPLMR